MQIAISLQENNGLVSQVSTIFGRCPYFMFINPDNDEFEIVENTAKAASGGAGIQAAQIIVDKGAEVVNQRKFRAKSTCRANFSGYSVISVSQRKRVGSIGSLPAG